MERMSFAAARARLTEIVNRVAWRNERIVVQRRGKDAVALISISDLEHLQAFEDAAEEAWAQDRVRRARRSKGKPVGWEKVRKDLGL